MKKGENNAEKKVGRRSKYDTHVKPYLEDIKQWRKGGATDEQICSALGIGTSAFYDYQNKYAEFAEVLKGSKEMLVLTLKGDLARMAVKHTLKTKKTYIKEDVDTGNQTKYTEITEKEVDGNLGAAHLLLKNFARDEWKNDWDTYELKKAQQQLNEMIAKEKYWIDLGNDENGK